MEVNYAHKEENIKLYVDAYGAVSRQYSYTELRATEEPVSWTGPAMA